MGRYAVLREETPRALISIFKIRITQLDMPRKRTRQPYYHFHQTKIQSVYSCSKRNLKNLRKTSDRKTLLRAY